MLGWLIVVVVVVVEKVCYKSIVLLKHSLFESFFRITVTDTKGNYCSRATAHYIELCKGECDPKVFMKGSGSLHSAI